MTVEKAADLFAEDALLQRPVPLLKTLGPGYLRLGQPATELSGG